MPVVKSSPLTHGLKGFSPYTTTTQYHHSSRLDPSSSVKIRAPYIDDEYSSPDFVPYGDWYPGPFVDGYQQCLPSLSSETYESLDNALFSWPYDDRNGYDPSFSFLTDSSPTSTVSYSPRSDRSALSPSLQPRYQEYATPFEFDFSTSIPHEFPSTTTFSSNNYSRASPSPGLSSNSPSPTPSCSSLDPADIKTSPSRDSSPLHTQTDSRRRFPCLIVGCERRFTSQYTLKVHMEAHKPKPRSSFPCTLGCAEKFSRQHDRLRHEVAKHGKVCEFSCEECGRFFSTRKTLSNHKCPLAHGGTRWVTN